MLTEQEDIIVYSSAEYLATSLMVVTLVSGISPDLLYISIQIKTDIGYIKVDILHRIMK